jgi:hypothetical protein
MGARTIFGEELEMLHDLIQKMIEAIVPGSKSNAWDQYKQARRLDNEASRHVEQEEEYVPRRRIYMPR